MHVEIEGLTVASETCKAIFDLSVASDKSYGGAKLLCRGVDRFLRPWTDDSVDGPNFILDGQKVTRKDVTMQGVAQPDVLDGDTQDLQLLTPFLYQCRPFAYCYTDLRYRRDDIAGIYRYLSNTGDETDDFHDESSGTLDEVRNSASMFGAIHTKAAHQPGCASHVVRHKNGYDWPHSVRLACG